MGRLAATRRVRVDRRRKLFLPLSAQADPRAAGQCSLPLRFYLMQVAFGCLNEPIAVAIQTRVCSLSRSPVSNPSQRTQPPAHLTKEMRTQMYNKIFTFLQREEVRAHTKSSVRTHSRCLQDAQQFLRGWFFNAPWESIREQNVIEWMAWALFAARTDQMSAAEREELQQMCALQLPSVRVIGL
jgi:hypothetical protein